MTKPNTEPRRIRPYVGQVILDRYGKRCQCIVAPGDVENAPLGLGGKLITNYIFQYRPGHNWCVDEPEGWCVERSKWTASERVFAVLLIGYRSLEWADEHNRDDMYEELLIEALIGVDDLAEHVDTDHLDHRDRWLVLASYFDERRTDVDEALAVL